MGCTFGCIGSECRLSDSDHCEKKKNTSEIAKGTTSLVEMEELIKRRNSLIISAYYLYTDVLINKPNKTPREEDFCKKCLVYWKHLEAESND